MGVHTALVALTNQPDFFQRTSSDFPGPRWMNEASGACPKDTVLSRVPVSQGTST